LWKCAPKYLLTLFIGIYYFDIIYLNVNINVSFI